MGIIIWIIFGAIVGFIASNIMGKGEGLLWDIILGIVGAIIGGFIMNLFGYAGITGFNLYSTVVAVIGAIIVIYIGRALRQKPSN
jgi:uncharacterized membrane protein YeaQ/YmgE (transglycosylase-associated protein family)